MQILTLRDRFRLKRFFHGLGPEAGPVRLDRSRIFILPTTAGLMFAFMLLVMLFGSINYNNSLGYMFTFLLGSMAMVSIFHAYRNLAGLGFAAGKTLPVHAGERAAFELLVSHPGGLPRYGIVFEIAGQAPVSIDLDTGHSAAVKLTRPALQRGVLALGRCKVASGFPLNLFRAWANLELQSDCLVYPRPGAPQPLSRQASYRPNQSGDKGRGVDDFAGFRPYRPGDSPRHLFWKAAAREQNLLVKQFGGDRADELWLDWNDLSGGDTEHRLSQLCRRVLDADLEQQRYGLRLPGKVIPIASGNAHKHRCLEALARFEQPG